MGGWFEEYFEYTNGAPSRLIFKFFSGTHGLSEELGRHTKRGVSQECPNCGACKESVEGVPFECASFDSQRRNFLDYYRQVRTQDAFEAFRHGCIMDKAVFSLGQKQGMLVNDECSLWSNSVGDFLMSIWDRRKEILLALDQ